MIKSFSGQVVFCFAILRAISAYVGENRLSQYSVGFFGHNSSSERKCEIELRYSTQLVSFLFVFLQSGRDSVSVQSKMLWGTE